MHGWRARDRGRRNDAALSKELTMTKIRKFSLIRLGDAKRLTQGIGSVGLEITREPGFDPAG